MKDIQMTLILKKDNSPGIRLLYYKNHPNDLDAKKDEDIDIRILYYRNNPNDLDAKKDEDWYIRRLYYENHIDDPDAKKDKDYYIRYLYYKNHPNDPDSKKDNSPGIRLLYYKNHIDDPDAKKDEYWKIRELYYKNNPDDPGAKKDEDEEIRSLYYENHPDDPDAKKDKHLGIRNLCKEPKNNISKTFLKVKNNIIKIIKGDNMSKGTQWVKCITKGCNGRWNWSVRNFCPICGTIYSKKPVCKIKKNDVKKNNVKKNNMKEDKVLESKSNTRISSWEVEIPCVEECSKAPKNITIWVHPTVKFKIDHLMKKMGNTEWLAYLVGEEYEVEDLVIPKQSVSSTQVTDITCDNYNNLSIIGVIHSHHDMGTNFSHTDDDWINQNHNISLVVSKKKINGQVRWKTPCNSIKIVPALVKLKIDITIETEEFDKIIEENIKRKTSSFPTCGINSKRQEIIKKDYPYSEFKELDFTDEKTLADELREMEESGMFDMDDKNEE